MKRKKKTSSELIVDALRTGEKLKLSEITKLMSQYAGTDIKIQNVSSTMAKLSDSEKTEIGHFINRHKTKQGYVYKLVDEALSLTPEQTYGLIRKVGKDRFTLKDALEASPALKKHVKGHGQARRPNGQQKPSKSNGMNATGNAGVELSIGKSDAGKNAEEDQLAKVVAQLNDGNLNININVNIRFVGFE